MAKGPTLRVVFSTNEKTMISSSDKEAKTLDNVKVGDRIAVKYYKWTDAAGQGQNKAQEIVIRSYRPGAAE